MPVNRGQGQTTRWYQLCFVPTSGDSSDDSDIESIILPPNTPTPTSTWQELSPFLPSPSPPPPNPEPQIDWRFPPPPPPPPPPFPPSPSLTPMQAWATAFDIELRHDRYQQFQPQPQNPSDVFESDHQSECVEVPVDVINAIRRVRISEPDEIEKLSHSHCPICMEEFKVGDRACRLPCNHTYRSECIIRWLNNNKTCPVCRLQLNDWEDQSCSYSIGDHSLDSEPEIPQLQPIQTNLVWTWEMFYPPSPGISVTQNGAGDNSDDADYDSACDELDDSREDGDVIGASNSAPASLI
ncbi:hypothetical protein VNO77_31133 [Canavalia gladiata]|uniref:RING-type E3 ubiquitin transferase n=1 Tax=Canavalia gladiata TaxID=3824 RepID=A0AAN9KQ36_CANGL